MRSLCRLIGLFVLLGLVSTAQAATYWVSASGGTTTTTCATASGTTDPTFYLRTIQAGVNCGTAAGSIVNVKAGTYVESVGTWPASGTSGNPITVRANPGATVTWRSASTATDALNGAVSIQDRSYLRIEGFTFSGTRNRATIRILKTGAKSSASNISGLEIVNNIFTDNGNQQSATATTSNLSRTIYTQGIGRELAYGGAAVNTISGNTFSGNYGSDIVGLDMSDTTIANNVISGTKSSMDQFNGHAFLARSISISDLSFRVTMQDNTVTDLQPDAYVGGGNWEGAAFRFDTELNNSTIQRNVVRNIGTNVAWSFARRGYGINTEIGSDNVIRENVVSGTTESCYNDASNATGPALRNDYLNNVGFSCGKGGIILMKSRDAIIRNNIFFTPIGAYVSLCSAGSADGSTCTAGQFGNNVWSHNLYWNTGATAGTSINVWGVTGSGGYSAANRTLSAWNSSSGETNSLLGNPLFINAPTDVHLQSTSPGCGTGLAGVDRGAYPTANCAAGAGDVTDPTAPTIPSATANASHQITLAWTQGTGAVGVTANRVRFCAGAACTPSTVIDLVTQVTGYVHTGLGRDTVYRYTVTAIDAALNESDESTVFSATTEVGGLVGHWACDEASGSCLDASGYGHTAILSGQATRTTGLVGANALLLDGTSDFATVTGNVRLSPTGAFAFSACIKTAATDSNSSEIMSRGDSATARILPSGNLRCIRRAGGNWNTHTTTGFNLLTNTIRHVVCQYSGTALEAYIDGVQAGSPTPMTGAVQYDQGANLVLGAHANGETIEDFNGVLDELRMYDRVLALGEIQTLSNTWNPPQIPAAVTVQHWRFGHPERAENSWVAPEDTARALKVDGGIRWRYLLSNQATSTEQAYPLWCNVNAGAYSTLTSDCSVLGVCMRPGGGVAHTDPLPVNRLTLPGGLNYVEGVAMTTPAWLSRTMAPDTATELSYDVGITGLSPADVVCCKPVQGDGTDLDDYLPMIPCVTVYAGSASVP